MSTNWTKKYIDLSKYIADNWSKDRSTKVGCIIVGEDNTEISFGYNGFPRSANDEVEERHQRPLKYCWTEHSERNAIYKAARTGKSTFGSKMYVTLFPCTDCARAIVQSGIKELICTKPDLNDNRWGESFKISLEILNECGVKITYID